MLEKEKVSWVKRNADSVQNRGNKRFKNLKNKEKIMAYMDEFPEMHESFVLLRVSTLSLK